MRRSWLILGGLTVLALLGLTIWQTTGRMPETLRIGAILFMTGPQASLGVEVKNALTVSLDEINHRGGIKGKKLELLIEDSKDSPRDAITAFNKLSLQNLPVMISTGDVVSLNLAPLANEKQVVLMATVAAGPDIVKNSQWVFRIFIQATRQAKAIAEYASKSLSLKSVAILHVNNEYGLAAYGNFKETFESLGGSVPGSDTYGIADRDVRAQITKLKALNPNAIFVAGFGDGYGAAIKQIRELGFKGLILSDNTLSIPYFQEQTRPANEGAYYTSTLYDEDATMPNTAKFIEQYRKQFGSGPGFIGAFAYDALQLLAAAIDKGGYSPAGIRNGLLSVKDHPGIVGSISFTPNGDIQFPLVIKKIEKGRPTLVQN